MCNIWKLRDVDYKTAEEFSRVLGLKEHISLLLSAKGIKNTKDAYHFINPKISDLYSPFLMRGMYDAVNRLKRAFSRNEKIGIFADSDLDGLTSLTVLLKLFEKFHIDVYSRYPIENDSYGLTENIIQEMKEQGIELLITLDSGIRDTEEIKKANSLGIDVIVCDHHQPGNLLPDAIIINPKQEGCPYPNKELAGVGVTFKFCHAVLISYLQSFNKVFFLLLADEKGISISKIMNGINEGTNYISDLYLLNDIYEVNNSDACNFILCNLNEDFIFDIDALEGKNIYTLKELVTPFLVGHSDTSSLGLSQLCSLFSINENLFERDIDKIINIFYELEYEHAPKVKEFINSVLDLVAIGTIADIMPVNGENRNIIYHGVKNLGRTSHPGLSVLLRNFEEVSSKSVSWNIAPLLNSPGRFGKTELTSSFLLEKNEKNINTILTELERINRNRKEIVLSAYKSIMNDIELGKVDLSDNVLFIRNNNIPSGVSGLLASRLVDTLIRPVIVVATAGDDVFVRGSGRATDDFDFLSYMEKLSFMFERIGGHAQAFGFTAKSDNLDNIEEKIKSMIGNSYKGKREILIDLEIPMEKINIDFIQSLSIFEPYGYKNEELAFLSRRVEIIRFARIGKEEKHGKYFLGEAGAIEAIGWNMADHMENLFENKYVDIVYRLEVNEFNNRKVPLMVITDINPYSSDN